MNPVPLFCAVAAAHPACGGRSLGLGDLPGVSAPTAGASSTTPRRRVTDSRRCRSAVAERASWLAELPRLWFGRPAADRHGSGEALIEAARRAGRGIVFLTPHLGCFEVDGARLCRASSAAITVLYRPARKPWLRELVDSARERANLATAPTTLAGVRPDAQGAQERRGRGPAARPGAAAKAWASGRLSSAATPTP